jgi:hypothetical protein
MTSTTLEQDLERFDFSSCNSVKERLYQQLLNMHRMENSASRNLWAGKKMGDEEMEWATAAGNPALQNNTVAPRGKK